MRTAKNGGFSLVELMVVVAIVGITLGLVLPAMGDLVQGVQLRTSRDALQDSLQRARFEAIRRNGRVVMCKSASGLACGTEEQERWHQGWIIFHDSENNAGANDRGDGKLGASETVLYREPALPAALRIRAKRVALPDYVSFDAQGGSRTIGGGLLMGTFVVCLADRPDIPAFDVVLRQGGRTRVEQNPVVQCS